MINRKGEGSPYGSFTFFLCLIPDSVTHRIYPHTNRHQLSPTLTPTLTYPHTYPHP